MIGFLEYLTKPFSGSSLFVLLMLESNPQPDLTSVALRCWWDVKVGVLEAADVLERVAVFRREKVSIA